MIQTHRQLKKQGYAPQFGGIDTVRPGVRYIGVTYSDEMREFLRLQMIGEDGWETVLGASERLEPKFVYQFLPADDFDPAADSWFLAFKTPSGLYGIRQSLGAGYLKELLRDLRRDGGFGQVFTSSLTYAKPISYRFRYNSLCEYELEKKITSLGWSWKFDPSATSSLLMPWDKYIGENLEGIIDYPQPARSQQYFEQPFGGQLRDQSASQIVMEEQRIKQQKAINEAAMKALADNKPQIDAYQKSVEAMAVAAEIAKMKAVTEQRWSILPQAPTPPPIAYVTDTQAAGWEPVRWYDNDGVYTNTAPVPTPEPPVVKSKYGRMIQFAKEGE